MDTLLAIQWHDMFVPQKSLLEIFLRGTVIYFLLLVLLRIFKRQAGSVGLSDLLVIVLVADASQNAMAAEYKSLTEGAVLIGTLVLWDQVLDRLGYHVPAVARLLSAPPVLLVKDGKPQRRNMRQEMISLDELMTQLRLQGVGELQQVKRAFIEGDGHISVLRVDGARPPSASRRRGEGVG